MEHRCYWNLVVREDGRCLDRGSFVNVPEIMPYRSSVSLEGSRRGLSNSKLGYS